MEASQDFRELLELFNRHGVEYVVVGGYALAYYGAPRFTADLDILVRPDEGNALRILDALAEFGFGTLDLGVGDFTTPGMVVQLGVPPLRVDLLTSLTGVSWDQASAGRSVGRYADVAVPFLGRQELIANKRALGRRKDLADIEALGEA